MKAKHIYVSGKVQGVGYRYFTQIQAHKLQLFGWVRNLPDGRVEIQVRGPEETLLTFEQILKQGPPRAQVMKLDIIEIQVETVDSTNFIVL